ncbi:MAG: cache domain-containing protein [Methanotrichaceae archaeon]|nr:cache domain-containing protein [Methanotrichaceae archaeon]
MDNLKTLIVAILLLSATFFITQSGFAADKSMSATNASLAATPTVKELVSFVESAAAYAKENGKDKAFKEFDNKTGQFVKGDLYTFAVDFNATMLANGKYPARIGKNWYNETDPNGVQFLKNEIEALRRGNSFFDYYMFPNPAHNNKPELKLGYFVKVDDKWYLGSGIYLSNISTSFDQKDRDDLVAFVKEARKFAKENRRQKVLEIFNDPKGNFTRNGRYIFANEYGGRILALPFLRGLIDKNRLDEKDPNGVMINHQASDAARRGNGFHYVLYSDPSNNTTQRLKLEYVTDVDGTWFIGSGIYAKGGETS